MNDADSHRSEASHETLLAELDRKHYPVTCAPMKAGDATFHAGWTLHTAPGNRTDRMRAVMPIIYFADGAKIVAPQHPDHQTDIDRWLPGLNAGDTAASQLNPILWRRM